MKKKAQELVMNGLDSENSYVRLLTLGIYHVAIRPFVTLQSSSNTWEVGYKLRIGRTSVYTGNITVREQNKEETAILEELDNAIKDLPFRTRDARRKSVLMQYEILGGRGDYAKVRDSVLSSESMEKLLSDLEQRLSLEFSNKPHVIEALTELYGNKFSKYQSVDGPQVAGRAVGKLVTLFCTMDKHDSLKIHEARVKNSDAKLKGVETQSEVH